MFQTCCGLWLDMEAIEHVFKSVAIASSIQKHAWVFMPGHVCQSILPGQEAGLPGVRGAHGVLGLALRLEV